MALIQCPECNRDVSDKARTCPNCGLPLQEATMSKPIEPAQCSSTELVCPSCGSEHTQTIKTMCLNGTTFVESNGFGVTSDLDVGIGWLNTNSQTALAEKYTPERSPAEIGGTLIGAWIFAWLIGKMVGSELGTFIVYISWVFLVLGILFVIVSTEKKSKAEREAKARLYEKGWICCRCGEAWVPSGGGASPTIMEEISSFSTVFFQISHKQVLRKFPIWQYILFSIYYLIAILVLFQEDGLIAFLIFQAPATLLFIAAYRYHYNTISKELLRINQL